MSVADVCGNSKNPPDTKPPSLIVNGTFDRPHTLHEGDQQQPPAAAFIIGGQDAQSGQFPWQVSIWDGEEHLCGGTLINDAFILTAAHCVRGRLNDEGEEDFSDYTFILGSTQIDGGVENALHLKAERVFRHHGYEGGGDYKNDIALVKVIL